jgi:thioredoxin reductase
MRRRDVIVVGAGPAGLAAAATAAALGLDVLMLDEQPGPGGQVHRAAESAPLPWLAGKSAAARTLAAEARLAGAAIIPGASVWAVTRALEIGWEVDGGHGTATARAIILATGARERAWPFPGWTLPGVMMAGAGQILLKQAGLGADGAVLAGSGPLLYLLAAQYLRAGFRPAALLDTTPAGAWYRGLPHLRRALLGGGASLLRDGVGLLARPLLAGVPQWREVSGVRAEGAEALERVRFRRRGQEHEIAARHLFVHQGVVPQNTLAAALGCAMAWDEAQEAWVPTADEGGRTSIAGVHVAGDAAGIGGADVAALRGKLVALAVAASLGTIDAREAGRRTAPVRDAHRRAMAARPLVDVLYAPAPHLAEDLKDDVMLCRCEEITVGQVRATLESGRVAARDGNALKSLLRVGMGPCQGRNCGTALCRVIAMETGCAEREVAPLRPRLPLKPVPATVLAEFHA